MRASFWSVYKRGRFSPRARLDKEPMEQRERFGVACLALCLQNDEEFCESFLSSICGVKDSLKGWTVEVDPYHKGWADILLRRGNHSIVVECKIHDGVEPHQDPWHLSKDFGTSGKKGYWAYFRDKFPEDDRVYVVLAANRRGGEMTVDHTRCLSATWSDLSKLDRQSSRWVHDLFLAFANLGYPHFRHMKAANLHIGNINEVLACHEVLNAVAGSLGISGYKVEHHASKETSEGSISDGYIGVEIAEFKKSQRKGPGIESLIASESKYKAWFGYELTTEASSLPRTELGVWFYCGSSKAAEAVTKRLGSVPGWEKKPMDQSADISEKHYLHFTKSPRDGTSDAKEFLAFMSRIIPVVG